MSGLGVLAAVAALVLIGLAALLLVDKRRPIRHLDDQPTDTGPWLGDGDLDRMTDERIAAEHNLHRRLR
ncbi:hypothetical protein [Amycolatopsis sp. NPDC049159]|uniref:hypothetical protein n=1 Tax=Amycolatopsis sp. NPDC049159 TaxID=3157210 RepID=UPI0033E5A173